MLTEHRPCSQCKTLLPRTRTFFYSNTRANDGMSSWCKECCKAHQKIYRGRTIERQRHYGRVGARRTRLRKYGLTEQSYAELLAAQAGVCAICKRPESVDTGRRPESGDPSLAIDHDHLTGKVRGLLCFFCNTAIGKFGDNPTLLQAAADYLERHAG